MGAHARSGSGVHRRRARARTRMYTHICMHACMRACVHAGTPARAKGCALTMGAGSGVAAGGGGRGREQGDRAAASGGQAQALGRLQHARVTHRPGVCAAPGQGRRRGLAAVGTQVRHAGDDPEACRGPKKLPLSVFYVRDAGTCSPRVRRCMGARARGCAHSRRVRRSRPGGGRWAVRCIRGGKNGVGSLMVMLDDYTSKKQSRRSSTQTHTRAQASTCTSGAARERTVNNGSISVWLRQDHA
jgi:hypothetical protein